MLRLIFLIFVFMLTSCSHLSHDNRFIANRDKEYLSAKSIPPLKIPPGMKSSAIVSHYPVPPNNYSDEQKSVSLVPPEL